MKKVLIPLLLIVIAVIVFYTIQGSGNRQEVQRERYLEELAQERREKNSFMRLDEESPLKAEQKKAFSGLKYFEPDPEWRIEARIEEKEEKELLVLPTSENKQKPFKKWGYAIFKKDGSEHRLLLLEPAYGPAQESLFLPFSDATSAAETYGAGRYLDIEIPENGQVTIDFNKAYNPYCAYAEGYSCPFPPKENMLPIAVTAGEKTFENYP